MEEIMKRAAEEDHDDVVLPGFRFHPTDEELVGFYLRRKVQKKSLSIQIIKEIDIYKHDPWDLPKAITAGEKETYFFCLRGRKYRNSIRPNRVTGSGFWKATGIDRPIHSAASGCIGLKKSLVYYRGSAGKGNKTDWMMHEFRLPDAGGNKTAKAPAAAAAALQDAEVWTICRIFKRSISYKKQPNSYKVSSTAVAHQIRQIAPESTTSSITSCFDQSDNGNDYWCSATSSTATATAPSGGCRGMELASHQYPTALAEDDEALKINNQQLEAYVDVVGEQWNSICQSPADPSVFFPPAGSTVQSPSIDEFLRDSSNWEELGKLAEFMAADESLPDAYCGYYTYT